MMREHGRALVLIVAVSGAVFVNALRAGFIWDDTHIVLNNLPIRDLRAAPGFFAPRYWRAVYANYTAMPGRGYRPVPEASFALDYAIWELNPHGYHLTNVLVNIANCVLVYFFAYRVFRDKLAATLCALLFATHPIHVEAVVWIKSRQGLLAFTFMLLSTVLYLRGVESSSPGQVWWLVASVLCFGAAMLSKASALVLPALLALYAWCFVPRRRSRGALLALLPLVGVAAAFFATTRCVYKVPHMPLPPVGQLASGIGIIGAYLRLLVFPVGLCLHYHFAPLHSLVDPEVLKAAPFGLAMVAGMVAAFRRSKTAFFALGWLAISLAPLSVLLLVGRPVADPRAYVPSVGFCILIVLVTLRTAPARFGDRARTSLRRVGTALCGLIVAIYAGLTVARTLDWVDEATIWRDTLAKNPHSWHGYRILGGIHLHAGAREKALEYFRQTIELRPDDFIALHQAAQLCERMGRMDEAATYYKMLLKIDPGNTDARVSLGMLYAATGARTQAIWQLTAALELDPNDADAHYNLGVLHANSGEYETAITHLRQAARLGGDRPLVHKGLGAAYEAAGRYELAIGAYERCLALEPGSADAWLGAGRCCERLGQTDEAARCYRRSIELGGPAAEEARRRLGALSSGQPDAERTDGR